MTDVGKEDDPRRGWFAVDEWLCWLPPCCECDPEPEFELALCDSPYGRRCVESTCGFPGLELGDGELGPAPLDDDAASKYCSGFPLTPVAAV